jgi:hypothetical protein
MEGLRVRRCSFFILQRTLDHPRGYEKKIFNFTHIHGLLFSDKEINSYGYLNWGPGEPNNLGGIEYCGSITRLGAFNDSPCNVRTVFICEKDKKSIGPGLGVAIRFKYRIL